MTTKQIASTTAMALCLTCLSMPVAAQEAAAGANDLYLGRIIIGYEGDGTPIYGGENKSVLEGKAITAQGGVATLDEVVRQVPGVTTLMNQGQPGVVFAIRGLGGSHIETTVEGVPQTFRFTGHNNADGFTYVDDLMLSSISVTRGASTTGGGGLAGSVNLSLLDVDDILAEDKATGGLVRLAYSDNGEGYAGVAAVALRRGPLELAFAGSNRDVSNYETGAGIKLPNTWKDAGSLLLRGAYQASDNLRFTFLAYDYNTKYATSQSGFVPGSVIAYGMDVTNTIYRIGFEYADGGIWDLSGTIYSGTTDHIHDFSNSPTNGATGRRMETETIGIDVKNVSTASFGDWTLTSTNGFDFSRDKLSGQNNATTIFGTNPTRGESVRKTVFSENVFENGPFEVMVGLRYSSYSLEGQLRDTLTTPGTTIINTYNVDHTSFDPTLSLAYRINDTFQPYMSVYRTSRSPTLQEAFLGGGDASAGHGGFVGNPSLRPEKIKGYEIGLNITRDDLFKSGDSLTGRIAIYDQDIEDLIVSKAGPTGAGMQFNNVTQTVDSKGLEVELGYESDVFSAVVAYAHADGKYGSGRLQPKNAFSTTLAGHFMEGDLTIGTTLTYNSNGPASIAFESAVNRDSYKTIDIFASYDVTENFRIDAKIANVTDELYTPWAATANSGYGRTAYLGAELRF